MKMASHNPLFRTIASLFLSYRILQVIAAPLVLDDSATALTEDQIASFEPFVSFAGAGYCDLRPGWSCGVYCDSHPNFQLSATEGDGGDAPRWYVGYDPDQRVIIVGHQGTNATNIISIANDANISLVPLPQQTFPGVPTDVTVHEGFLKAQTSGASGVLSAVNSLLQSTASVNVFVIGHSLGAAVASLTGVMLRLQLSADISVKVVAWASPRVGNENFADLVDEILPNIDRINNKKDPVPILPGRLLGYVHVHGEIYIEEDNTWYSCPGRENGNENCTDASVPTILDADVNDHGGPYFGLNIGSANCTH